MKFEDILSRAERDEFGNMCGFAPFPWFQREIEVICDENVTPEYAARSLRWLAEMDGSLMEEICRYACYYLKDTLECTSVGELLDEKVQQIQEPLEILEYMEFNTLWVNEPGDPDLPVLDLSGSCVWQEDEGVHCKIQGGHVLYLGGWDSRSVWRCACQGEEDYLFNYVYYTRRAELQAKAAERLAREPVQPLPHLEIPMSSPIRHFIEHSLSLLESCSFREAWAKMEDTLLFQFLQDYPALSREDPSFLCQCYLLERDRGPGELAQFLAEERDFF